MKKILSGALMLALSVPFSLAPTVAFAVAPTTVSFGANKDTYIDQQLSSNNFGGANDLDVKSRSGSNNKRVLIAFDLSSIPAGATITSATLKLYVNGAPSSPRTHEAHRVTSTWSESGVKWSNAPTFSNVVTGSASITSSSNHTTVSWDVTSDVSAFINGTYTNNGWLIKDGSEDAGSTQEAKYASKEQSSKPDPELVVVYTPAPVNHAPVATDTTLATNEDTAGTATLTATDADSDALTYSIVDAPSHGTLGAVSGNQVAYTPDANYNGPDSFTFKANDGASDSNTSTVSVTVSAVNDAPTAFDDAYGTPENTGLDVPASGVLSNDTDVENDTLSALIVSSVTNGTLTLNADGSFAYVPDEDFTGSDTFTYKANDGASDSNVATVTINVSNTDETPTAVADSYSLDQDTTLSADATTGVLANDSDGDGDMVASLVTNPAHGSLTLNADGSFDYTPEAGYFGADSFVYTANDDGNVSSETIVTITVNEVVADVCPNIDGVQATVPDGDQLTDGNCVPVTPLTDVCPNIEGNQDAVPEGDVLLNNECVPVAVCSEIQTLDTETNTCVDNQSETDVCPNIDGVQATVPEGDSIVDGQCVTTPVDNTNPPTTPSNGGGGGGGGGGNGPIVGSIAGGQVLGAFIGPEGTTTGEVLGASCSPYLTSYLGLGKKNDAAQVTLLQQFLNDYLHLNIPVTGIFGQQTFNAVKQFQLQENTDVLMPWVNKGLLKNGEATGYVYKTTLRKINLLKCSDLDIPVPQLP